MILAVAFLLGSTVSTADAAKKKNKKQKQETVAENEQVQKPLILYTANDSLSYAAGKASTQGLIPYLQQQLKVDTAYMDDFVKGYEESLTKQDDPKFIAYQAGMEIAKMTTQRILPSMKADFEGSDQTVAEDMFHKGFLSSIKSDNSIYSDSAAQA